MATHTLKITERDFEAIIRGDKRFLWRRGEYNVGDVLHLIVDKDRGVSVTVRHVERYGDDVVVGFSRQIRGTVDSVLFYFEHLDLTIAKFQQGSATGDVALCPRCGHRIGVRVKR